MDVTSLASEAGLAPSILCGIVKGMGIGDVRIHDLRHTFAVNSLRAGDDIKTIQENLGHAMAAFTLDVYGHCTSDMKKASSQRMEKFIESRFCP